MDTQVLWQAGDHLAAPGQHFSFQQLIPNGRISLTTVPPAWRTQETHRAALLGQPASVHCRAGVVQPGIKSREDLSKEWNQNHACVGTCFPPLPPCPAQIWGGVQTVQTWGKVWCKHNLRLKISFRSTHGFFPTSSSGITFSHSKNTPNIFVKTSMMMIKLDKALRD